MTASVKKQQGRSQPKIVVQDLVLRKKFYRITGIKLKNTKYKRSTKEKTDEFYIIWHDQEEFKRGFSQLKRRYDFQNIDIENILGTTTHRYVSTSFTAKGFKP